ncbi:MAG TPA: hypothetical protein VH561_16780 [Micromonosporaceae bacterium]|jgi:hypothetical protein
MKLSLVVSFVLGAIFSGAIQLVLAIVFEANMRRAYRRIRGRVLSVVAALRGAADIYGLEYFRVGGVRVNCIVLEGTASTAFLSDALVGNLRNDPIRLPDDLRKRYDDVTRQQAKIARRTGHPTFTNGPMVSLEGWSRGRTLEAEDALLTLRFRMTDYYTFLATAMSLDNRIDSPGGPITIRDKYLGGRGYRSPNPLIATSFGVNLALVTHDRYTFLSRRGTAGLSSYAGKFAVPIAESVHPAFDASGSGRIDFALTAQRGAMEEVNIEVKRDEIALFSLVVDTTWYLYGLTGAVYSSTYGRDDVIAARSLGTKDRWEADQMLPIPFSPTDIARFIKDNGGTDQFSPSSIVAVVQALIHYFGERTTYRTFRSEFR